MIRAALRSLPLLVLLALPLALPLALLGGCRTTPDYGRPLPPGAPALLPVGPHERLPDFSAQWSERDEILPALERSIAWMQRPSAQRHFPKEGVEHARALASLERFRELLLESRSAADFERALLDEFQVYKSAGWDGKGGGVLFTGYCTPILEGSLARDERHRWPLYALPSDLEKGPEGEILGRRTAAGLEPYPTRRAIEANALLDGQGLELVWLADPLDAYIAHVNGSAFVRLEDGSLLRLGYAGKNGQEYSSLGQALVRDGKMKAGEVNLAALRRWSKEDPDEVLEYLRRNDSYVFFAPIDGNPRGSLNVEVTGGRTIATDKALFPRASLVYVDTRYAGPGGEDVQRFFLDQDTGGAIRTAGRADLYLGVGPEAEQAAGATRAEGQMYYLFLKDVQP